MRELLGMPMVPLLRGDGTELAWKERRGLIVHIYFEI